MKLCIPVAAPNGLASMIEPHLPQAEHLLFFDTELRTFLEISLREQHEGAGEDILMDAVLCGSINRITLKTLIEQGIEVYGTEAQTVAEAIAQFENGELQAAVMGSGGCGGHGHAHAGGGGACCSGHDSGQGKDAGEHGCGGGGCGGAGGCSGHGKDDGHHAHDHDHGHSHAHAAGGCCGSRAAQAAELPVLGEAFKIAVCSQNRKTVTEHAGKCRKFWVYDIAQGQVIGRNLLELTIEQSFHEAEEGQAHPLDSVDVLITGSIGGGLQQRLMQRGIVGVVTSETDLDQAVADFLAGKIESAPVSGGGCTHGCGETVSV